MKNSKQRVALILFLIVSILHLISFLVDDASIQGFTKPIIIPLLFSFFYNSDFNGSARSWVLGALVFSWLGDVLLMFQEDDALFFMLGLGAFLIAHILYVVSYLKATNQSNEASILYKIGVTVLFIAYGAFFMFQLWPTLGEMKLPVGVYALVITAMLCTGAYRLGKTNAQSFKWVLLGALAFVTSDSLLAINKFMEPIPMAGFLIMITYILAQFSIVWGIIKHQYAS